TAMRALADLMASPISGAWRWIQARSSPTVTASAGAASSAAPISRKLPKNNRRADISAARGGHEPRDGRRGAAPFDDEVMALRLAADGVANNLSYGLVVG